MTDFVLDASVAMAWCFEDETSPEAVAILDRLGTEEAAVPSLWHLEIANVLTMAERRGRITATDAVAFAGLLESLEIKVAADTPDRALHDIRHLARTENLSAYDAAYLDLAMRLDCPLATRVKELNEAAARLGVGIMPT